MQVRIHGFQSANFLMMPPQYVAKILDKYCSMQAVRHFRAADCVAIQINVTPERFYRGSSLITGEIPARIMRE